MRMIWVYDGAAGGGSFLFSDQKELQFDDYDTTSSVSNMTKQKGWKEEKEATKPSLSYLTNFKVRLT